jgi:hypothetical protein
VLAATRWWPSAGAGADAAALAAEAAQSLSRRWRAASPPPFRPPSPWGVGVAADDAHDEASTTRSPCTPCTRSCVHHVHGPRPMRQLPTGWRVGMAADELGTSEPSAHLQTRAAPCRPGQPGPVATGCRACGAPPHHALQVVLIGQEVRVYQRQGHGVSRPGPPAPGCVAAQAHMR